MPNEDNKNENKIRKDGQIPQNPIPQRPIQAHHTMPSKGVPAQNLQNQAIKKGTQKAAQKVPGIGLLAQTKQGRQFIDQAVDAVDQVTNQQKETGVEEQQSTPLFNNKKKGLSRFLGNNDNHKEEKKDDITEVFGKLKKYKLPLAVGFGGIGCFAIIFLILMVIAFFMNVGDLFKMDVIMQNFQHAIKDTAENIANTFSGCWFQSKEECLGTQRDKFFKEINKVHSKFQREYGVNLDSALLVSTLTYQNMDDIVLDDEDYAYDIFEGSLSASDYRKIRKMIDSLANHMAPVYYYEVPSIDENGNETTVLVRGRRLDLEEYKRYLKEEFIPEYYYVDENKEEIEVKVNRTLDEIYLRVEFYRDLVEGGSAQITYASQCNYNTTKVEVLSCDTDTILASDLSLKDYILGVVYGEIGYSDSFDDAYYQTMMIAAKTFALSRGRYNSATKRITLRACEADQVWCDINTGCYRDKEKETSSYHTMYPMGYDLNTVNNSRTLYKNPLSAEAKTRLSGLYDQIANYLYLDESFTGEITSLGSSHELHYRSATQNVWKSLASEGNDFETILKLTGNMEIYDSPIAQEYATRKLYDLSEHCRTTGYTGNGNYQLIVNANGSINVDNPIDFFSQMAAGKDSVVKLSGIATNYKGSVINRTDSFEIWKCSCGPTSFSMITAAIGNINYLDEYFTNVTTTGGSGDEKLYVIAKMHRYLADQGIQGYPDGFCGGLFYASSNYNDTIYAPLGIKFHNYHSRGNITSQMIYDYLAQGNLLMYNIQGAQCATQGACGGFGRTSSGHFGIIYGYDANTDEFLVYDPVRTTYQPIRVSSTYVPKLNSITVWGGI